MSAIYAAFSEVEHRERLERSRNILKQHEIECCVSVAPEHLYYLAGYDSWVSVNSLQALIFMADGDDPTLIVRDVDHALPLETSWVSDVRSYHLFSDDVAALIASVTPGKGLSRRKGRDRNAILRPALFARSVPRACARASPYY
jgi:Xaa-Pro dipeptidase